VLITAGGGGVGSAAIQIAKKVLGLTVIGTASRAETVAFTNSCGADHVVSHRKSFAPQSKKLGIETVDYVFHCSDLTPALFTEFVDIVKPVWWHRFDLAFRQCRLDALVLEKHQFFG
jgi:NADPH:quinone reductase-like Zn-dependent oxidoreductase